MRITIDIVRQGDEEDVETVRVIEVWNEGLGRPPGAWPAKLSQYGFGPPETPADPHHAHGHVVHDPADGATSLAAMVLAEVALEEGIRVGA